MIFLLGGIIVFLALITSGVILYAWIKYSGNLRIELMALRSYNKLSTIWPVDEYFFSLHFKVIRSALTGIIALVIIQFVTIKWIVSAVMALVLFIFVLSIPLQRTRSREWANSSVNGRGFLRKIRTACTITFYYQLAVYIVMLIGYGLL